MSMSTGDLSQGLPATTDVQKAGGIIKNPALSGKSFASRCPLPDIHPNTKIVAVCGINDWKPPGKAQGLAAPQEDGWFFSDMYLYHHLFSGIFQDQVWLTCVSPRTLVEKYGPYVHGDPKFPESRRVVLDEDMLDDLNDVRVVHPKDLLERFLSTLRSACSEVREQNRPLLILILSHGEMFVYTFDSDGRNRRSKTSSSSHH